MNTMLTTSRTTTPAPTTTARVDLFKAEIENMTSDGEMLAATGKAEILAAIRLSIDLTRSTESFP